MLFLGLAACQTVVHGTTCATEQFPVADDEIAGDLAVSAADVLAAVLGPFVFGASREADGAPVRGQGEVVRGSGEVMFTDATRVADTSRRLWIYRIGGMETSYLPCDDRLEVPVDAWIRTDDGVVDLSLDTVAVPLVSQPTGEPDWYEISGDVDPAEVIAMPGGPDTTWWPALALQWSPTDFHWVSLWWEGPEGGDYLQVFEGPGARTE